MHETFVQFQAVADEAGQVSIEFTPEGKFTCKTAVLGTFRSETKFEKPTGKTKIVFSQGDEPEHAFLQQASQLLNSFDVVAAIDAGSVYVDGVKVSTACLAMSTSPLTAGAVEFELQCFAYFDVPEDINPEMVALDLACKHFFASKTDLEGKRIGLVTDTELGKHDQINSRSIPYLGDNFLPEGIRLIYASFDTGHGPAHDLIRICDTHEKLLRASVLAHPEWIQPKTDQYQFCRGWIVNRTTESS